MYTHIVHEVYSDGFVWRHYASSREEADQIAEDLYAAHKGRTYHVERIEG